MSKEFTTEKVPEAIWAGIEALWRKGFDVKDGEKEGTWDVYWRELGKGWVKVFTISN